MLTGVSVVWNGPGGCEIRGTLFENHATFLEKGPIILIGDRVRSKGPGWQPTLMLVASSRWPHLRSTFKSSHHPDTTFHTMRHIALSLPAPANRACVFAAHRGRSREERSRLDRHFAIDWLAGKTKPNTKIVRTNQSTQVAGFSQHVVEGAIGTRNRNEPHLTNVDGFSGQRVLTQDPGCRSRPGFASRRWIARPAR